VEIGDDGAGFRFHPDNFWRSLSGGPPGGVPTLGAREQQRAEGGYEQPGTELAWPGRRAIAPCLFPFRAPWPQRPCGARETKLWLVSRAAALELLLQSIFPPTAFYTRCERRRAPSSATTTSLPSPNTACASSPAYSAKRQVLGWRQPARSCSRLALERRGLSFRAPRSSPALVLGGTRYSRESSECCRHGLHAPKTPDRRAGLRVPGGAQATAPSPVAHSPSGRAASATAPAAPKIVPFILRSCGRSCPAGRRMSYCDGAVACAPPGTRRPARRFRVWARERP